MGSIVFKEITFIECELKEILNNLRQSGAIIQEYDSSSVLVRIDNLNQFINKFKQTKTYNLTSLKEEKNNGNNTLP